MIQVQDLTVFDIPVETKSFEQRIITNNIPKVSSSYLLAYDVQNPKKPIIVTPQTKTISPVSNYLIYKLKTGTLEEQSRCLISINKNLETKGAVQHLDAGLTDALFNLINTDISVYQDINAYQKRLRTKAEKGKKLTTKQYKKAYTLSQREKAEQNQVAAVLVLAKIQNLLYSELKKRSGLQPTFYDLPAVKGLINSAKNNKSDNVKVASVCALAIIYKPEFYKDYKAALTSIAETTTSKNVQKEALYALKLAEEKNKQKNN